ncbi:MAG: helix-turn-helix transcriptional regulator [Longibaculum muris]|uniref:DNA-binding XRE family transcriptional regulator n=1 Tax=Longibaculum muris TaxID=1796628 RepID=A0A4R3YXE2_9FIRM|nr:helix-turn-helix transcriptional regulator [Longibaculum muris]KXU52269.1 DNA-binding helix-turn-helix protein [Candidatus Stoquefichus sp. KLE1796]MBS5370068.1 helix-turn-helix transcriptional regulator [Coprobacillus cateniformis]MCR1887469.1 helix-turn-helix domain-containing protein [Longibaculum muris]MED9811392.1 helix-turn-helix transcriptional regulator [Longibaculum muris]TCV97845.1 DNA-binding XRE family transcriptional regulator [Longibaculum muris]
MKIGEKLRDARNQKGLTQEEVADEIHVSRQTISNWENNRSYPDIISVILLSDLYQMSLDVLLKGDKDMIEHLNESTDIVNSNKKLIIMGLLNIVVFIFMIIFNQIISENKILLASILSLSIISITIFFYQIIRKF